MKQLDKDAFRVHIRSYDVYDLRFMRAVIDRILFQMKFPEKNTPLRSKKKKKKKRTLQ